MSQKTKVGSDEGPVATIEPSDNQVARPVVSDSKTDRRGSVYVNSDLPLGVLKEGN